MPPKEDEQNCPNCGHGRKQHDALSCTTRGCMCNWSYMQVGQALKKR